MMLSSSNTCRFVLFYFLSHSANAETDTVRGVHRELTDTAAVNLGTAGDFVILAKTGISTVPNSVITGNIGVSPITGTAMTGFDLILVGVSSTSTQVNGELYAADYADPTPTKMITAVGAMETAFTDAAGRANANAARINMGTGLLGGVKPGGPTDQLTPGVYTFSTNVLSTGDIHFKGSETDIFIIQIAGNLILAANDRVTLEGGALAKNIFWQVAGYAEVGAGAHMEGILLVKTAVTFITGSSLNGRVLTQTACNLQKATITQPAV
jgi:hypothetical protein